MGKVSIVIPNWNSSDLMQRYLPSVLAAAAATPDVVEVLVVDDGSTDGSRELLAKEFPSVRVHAMGRNRGFGVACNTGVIAARGQLILLLNTDVELRLDSITPLIEHFATPRLFAVAPVVYFPDQESIYQGRSLATFTRGRFTFLSDDVGRTDLVKEPCFSLFACGGMGMFRREMFLRLGGFDPLYRPLYYEDTDLGFRAWKRGWITVLDPRSVMVHQHRGTMGRMNSERRIQRLEERNTLLFTWKNISDRTFLLQHLLFLPYHLAGSAIGGRIFLEAFGEALRLLPQALVRRIIDAPHRHPSISDTFLLRDILQLGAEVPEGSEVPRGAFQMAHRP